MTIRICSTWICATKGTEARKGHLHRVTYCLCSTEQHCKPGKYTIYVVLRCVNMSRYFSREIHVTGAICLCLILCVVLPFMCLFVLPMCSFLSNPLLHFRFHFIIIPVQTWRDLSHLGTIFKLFYVTVTYIDNIIRRRQRRCLSL